MSTLGIYQSQHLWTEFDAMLPYANTILTWTRGTLAVFWLVFLVIWLFAIGIVTEKPWRQTLAEKEKIALNERFLKKFGEIQDGLEDLKKMFNELDKQRSGR